MLAAKTVLIDPSFMFGRQSYLVFTYTLDCFGLCQCAAGKDKERNGDRFKHHDENFSVCFERCWLLNVPLACSGDSRLEDWSDVANLYIFAAHSSRYKSGTIQSLSRSSYI